MLVIQNRKIKKGIEIPEIEIVLGLTSVTFNAIDKVKYADFLNLGIIVAGEGRELAELTDYIQTAQYNGDELEIVFDYSVLRGYVVLKIEE